APGPAERPLAARPEAASPGFEDVPVSMMRKLIAKRLSESKNAAPHFYASVDVDMAPAWAAREGLKRLSGADVSFNDIVVKATAVTLTRHPAANASWQGDSIRYHRSVDIGVAVSVPDGLIVPVVRACHAKGLLQISEEIRALAERARERKLEPEEYQGSTFTVSNLGMLGVTHFTGILNPPEACLLAVGGIRAVPVVEGDRIVPGKRMTLTLSCDHRVVDGAQAARFLDDLRKILENPFALAL
ncbi:MAG: dihydrolipoamide acetyltransferase family protein, partial [Planctomycetota bacterium]